MPQLLSDVQELFNEYSTELKSVEQELLNLFNSTAFLIPAIGNYIVQSGGKRLRPLFLILSAELCEYREYPRIRVASIIEAIHTASLLHDDVVDGADLRRGKPTAHSVWGNQVVILVGDFLYSNALKMAVSLKNQKIMDALSFATTKMTEGELLQLSKIGDPEISEDEYIQIISAKTGALISAACRIGAILSKKGSEQEERLGAFGLKTGIVFQMVDDILDYMAREDDLGKRLCKDLDEGKVTMPIIYLLKVCDNREREFVRTLLSDGIKEDDHVKELNRLFRKYDVIEECIKIATDYVKDAKAELDGFGMSPEKERLLCLAEYALKRSK